MRHFKNLLITKRSTIIKLGTSYPFLNKDYFNEIHNVLENMYLELEMKQYAQGIAENMKLDLDLDVFLDDEIDCDALIKDSGSVKIYINPKSRIHRNKNDIMSSIEHEMGHLYLIRKHSKTWKLFQYLQKPNSLLERLLSFNKTIKQLSTPLISGCAVLLALFSTHLGHIDLLWPLLGLGIYLIVPYLVEESLAFYLGSKYRMRIVHCK